MTSLGGLLTALTLCIIFWLCRKNVKLKAKGKHLSQKISY